MIDKPLGKGGMGSIFLAHDTRLDDKPVVIKEMLHTFANDAERIEAEAAFMAERKTLSALRHPNIPQITDFPTESGRYFIVQDFVDGEDLQKKLDQAKGKGLPEKQVLGWASQVLSVLDYLENRDPQVIHRDIKPANILVDDAGRVHVVDFGVASQKLRSSGGGAGYTKAMTAMGTPGYAPREQFEDKETPLSDIYALGATMHQLLTGRNPQGVQPYFVYPPIRSLNPAVSDATVRIVNRALQNDPRQRWQHAREMKAAVDDLLRPKGLLSTARGRVLALAVIVLALIGVGGGAAVYERHAVTKSIPTPVPAVIYTGSSAASIHLTGAGSTFDAPFFATAFNAYGQTHPLAVRYDAAGSGAGIARFAANQVDFGATDVPMNDVELAAANRNGSGVLQLPILLGGVAITYNLGSGFSSPLQLDGPTLASIFLGKITRWNDPAIAALNPGVKLPDLAITPVHRSDSSGTNYIFTDYLSSVSTDWLLNAGRDKSVHLTTGVGAAGNAGVAAAVKAHQGAIGYVELKFAIENSLPYMKIRNRAGQFVLPTSDTILAAANQFPNVDWQHFSIVNAPGATSYPIASYSWVLVRAHHANVVAGEALIRLFSWLTTNGQTYAPSLNYVPLPDNVRLQSANTLANVHVG